MVEDIINHTNTRTVAHELGHTAGWNHPHDKSGNADPQTTWEAMTPTQMNQNLMSQTWFSQTQNSTSAQNISREITYNQMVLLRNNSVTGNLNKNSPLYTKHKLGMVRVGPFLPPLPIGAKEKALRK